MKNSKWLKDNGVPIVCQGIKMIDGEKKFNFEPQWQSKDYTNEVEVEAMLGRDRIGVNFSFIGKENKHIKGKTLICIDIDLKPLSNLLISQYMEHNVSKRGAVEFSNSGKGMHIFYLIEGTTPNDLRKEISKRLGKIKFKGEDNVGIDLFTNSSQVLLANEINWDSIQTLSVNTLIEEIEGLLKSLRIKNEVNSELNIYRTSISNTIKYGDNFDTIKAKNPIINAFSFGVWPGYAEMWDNKIPFIYYACGKWEEFIATIKKHWPQYLGQWEHIFEKDGMKEHAEKIKIKMSKRLDWQFAKSGKIIITNSLLNAMSDDIGLKVFHSFKIAHNGKRYSTNITDTSSQVEKWLFANLPEHINRDTLNRDVVNDFVKKVIEDNFGMRDSFSQDNKDLVLLPVKNGTLNVITKKLEQSQEVPTTFDYLDVDYDPTVGCADIETYVKYVIGERYSKEWKKIIGSILLKDLHLKDKKFIAVVVSSADYGKSGLGRLIQDAIGYENSSSVSISDLGGPFNIKTMENKWVNISGEMTFNDRDGREQFKKITGRDPVKIESKGIQGYESIIKASILGFGNEFPNLKLADDATKKRIHYYNLDVEHNGVNLITRLKRDRIEIDPKVVAPSTWRQQMLNYMLEGLEMYLKQDLIKDQNMMDLLQSQEHSQIYLSNWVQDGINELKICNYSSCGTCLMPINFSKDAYLIKDLKESAGHWLQKNGKSTSHLMRDLDKVMSGLGYQKVNTTRNGVQGWHFVKAI